MSFKPSSLAPVEPAARPAVRPPPLAREEPELRGEPAPETTRKPGAAPSSQRMRRRRIRYCALQRLSEVRHARICFALAQGYAGAPLGPSSFPFDGAMTLGGDLASLATSTAREGCIGETLAALIAAEQLAHAKDPAVRRALSAIAEDEARHVELAWRTVAWAIDRGGEAVRDAVAAVFAEAAQHAPAVSKESAIPASVLLPHGRLDSRTTREALVRALDEVICPAFASLLHRAPAAITVASAAA